MIIDTNYHISNINKQEVVCITYTLLPLQMSSSVAECEPNTTLRVADSPGGGTVTGGAVVNVAPLASMQGVHLGAPPVGHPNQAGAGGHQQPAQQNAPRPHPQGVWC